MSDSLIKEVELLFKKNAFELFDLNLQYNIDKKLLKQNYLLLQKKYHPDKYITQSKVLSDLMSNLSVHINQQYKLLINPVQRSILFFKIFNYPFNINDNSKLTPEFLIKQMNLQEEIESIRFDQNKLCIIEEELLSTISFMEENIHQSFIANNFDEASRITIEISFYIRIYDRILHDNNL